MPIEPVKIPQNVYIEDRIIGPLTLRQIIISMLGIGFSYAVWASVAKVYGYVPLHITVIVWIPAVLAIIFAFVRVNDLSMAHILLLLAERMNKPQTRIYGPRRGLSMNLRTFSAPTKNAKGKTAAKAGPGDELGRLTEVLDGTESEESYESQESEVTTTTTNDEVQASALPPRPVVKGRVSVSPLLNADLEGLENTDERPLLHDIVPPATNAR